MIDNMSIDEAFSMLNSLEEDLKDQCKACVKSPKDLYKGQMIVIDNTGYPKVISSKFNKLLIGKKLKAIGSKIEAGISSKSVLDKLDQYENDDDKEIDIAKITDTKYNIEAFYDKKNKKWIPCDEYEGKVKKNKKFVGSPDPDTYKAVAVSVGDKKSIFGPTDQAIVIDDYHGAVRSKSKSGSNVKLETVDVRDLTPGKYILTNTDLEPVFTDEEGKVMTKSLGDLGDKGYIFGIYNYDKTITSDYARGKKYQIERGEDRCVYVSNFYGRTMRHN